MKTIVFLIFLVLVPCKEYIGYTYNVEELDLSVSITRMITNIFSEEAVDSTLVQIGEQKTRTYEYGQYRLLYLFTDDDVRNKPASITVSAVNYKSNSSQIIITPGGRQINVSLVYISPIILHAKLEMRDSLGFLDFPCEAVILDYQGIGDIKKYWNLYV